MTLPYSSTDSTLLLLVLHCGVLPEDTEAVSLRVLPTDMASVPGWIFTFGCLTVIVQDLDTPSAVAVILAVPCLMAVTKPFSSTVATLLLLDFQVGVCPVDTDAVSCFVPFR